MPSSKYKHVAGFTLIEVMIVVAIVAILSAISYPSYQNMIAKSRRADAQLALEGFAQAMERHYTDNGTYLGAGTVGGNTGAPTIFPTKTPTDGSQTYYNLTIEQVTLNSYTLYATPVGPQVGDGVLGLTSTGLRGWDRGTLNNDPFDAGETCWEQTCS